MNRKISTLLLAAILMMFTVAGNVMAQGTYYVGNDSPVPVTVCVVLSCPGSSTTVCIAVPPGATGILPVPVPPCVITGVIFNGILYPVGYSGPIVSPPPPTRITVTPLRAFIQ